MTKQVKAIPDGFTAITPYIVVNDGNKAIDFYKRAFGANEIYRMPGPDGRIMHAEIEIGGSRIMISDEMPEMGSKSPVTLKGTPVSIFLYVENVDEAFKKAVDAGAKTEMPVTDMFWGDRYSKVIDPFGHHWQIATHKEDLTPEELGQRAAKAFSQSQ